MVKYKSLKSISGWLGPADFELFRHLITFQNTFSKNALVEIGVHHGKSFVPLGSFSEKSKLYAIDIFEEQSGNIDFSGNGNLKQFTINMKRYGIEESRVIIDQRLSSHVKPQEIKNSVGSVRFFHIDGGHHFHAVASDLELATAVASEETVIVLDDVFRPEWPEVTTATFGSAALRKHDFIMFAIGFNKAYFCNKAMLQKYQESLKKDVRILCFLSREYKVDERPVLVFQRYPMPEWGWVSFMDWYLSIWHPEFFMTAWQRSRAIKNIFKLNRNQ